MRIRYQVQCPTSRTIDFRGELEHMCYLMAEVKQQYQAKEWCMKHNPILVVRDNFYKKELLYGYNEGYIGDQLLLV